MAKYKLKRNCFFEGVLYKAGEVVDFGKHPAPKTAEEVSSLLDAVKAKKAPAKDTKPEEAEKEDALLKDAKK